MIAQNEPNLQEFSVDSLFKNINGFAQRGITEVYLSDKNFSKDKAQIMRLLDILDSLDFPLFVSLKTDVAVIDRSLCAKAAGLSCSLEIPLLGTEKAENLLFDRNLYAKKAKMLNEEGTLFGYEMDFAGQTGDSARLFRERLDFAIDQYPNHIRFLPLEQDGLQKGTAVFSLKDMDLCRGIAFSCLTFYSEGRAVPWFKTVLESLRIKPSVFFSDFAEWQRCNNCSEDSGFNPYETPHAELEKMQLVFLEQKYEEKHLSMLTGAVRDIVLLNGAFSRLVAEGEECTLDLSYNPDDLLSPAACNLVSFCDAVTMEECRVRVFDNGDGPDYRVLA